MLERIAVDLRRRRDHEARTFGLGQTKGVVGPQRADFQRLNRQFQIVDGAGGAGPMEHRVHRAIHIDVLRHIVANEFEVARAQMGDIGHVAGDQVVDADHRVAAIEQRFGQMRADESGGAGDDDARGRLEWSQYATPRVNSPRTRVSHMIFRSSVTDQFSM
jgi:hypothetical protein